MLSSKGNNWALWFTTLSCYKNFNSLYSALEELGTRMLNRGSSWSGREDGIMVHFLQISTDGISLPLKYLLLYTVTVQVHMHLACYLGDDMEVIWSISFQ